MNGGEINDNQAVNGGGVFATFNSTFSLQSGKVTGNVVTTDGGGFRMENSILTLSGGEISKNTATDGAGLSASGNSNVTLNNGMIEQNTAARRGGGANILNNASFAISGGEIRNNKAASGGGAFVGPNSTFAMQNGKVTDNIATADGGGLYLEDSGLAIDDGEISSNMAKNGGGVYLNTSAQLTMNGGAIRGNQAAESGGGIFTDDSDYHDPVSTTAYQNVTIAGIANVSGNTSIALQRNPSNHAAFANFDGTLLNNNQINYYPSTVLMIYDPNISRGGLGVASAETYAIGAIATVQSPATFPFSPAATNYEFKYWCTNASDVGGTRYYPGNTFTITTTVRLYAIWGKSAGTPGGGNTSNREDRNAGNSVDATTLHLIPNVVFPINAIAEIKVEEGSEEQEVIDDGGDHGAMGPNAE